MRALLSAADVPLCTHPDGNTLKVVWLNILKLKVSKYCKFIVSFLKQLCLCGSKKLNC